MADLSCALAWLGHDLAELQRISEQLILFGSRAAGLGRSGSDWDLMVVGEGRSRHTSMIDLVWVSPRELATAKWLGSELAGHVACWGRWLHGKPDWVGEVSAGGTAREHKAQRLASKLDAMEKAWHLLHEGYQREHRTLVRRDLQRHALLAEGKAVPPSRMLDEVWQACPDPRGQMLSLGLQAGVCSAFFEAAVASGAESTPPRCGRG